MKIKHVGLHANRINHPCSQKEAAFASHWRHENEPPVYINSGRGILDHLLYMSPDQQQFTGESTEREESVAASVIQWLGTSCGWCFLESTLKDCGFVIQSARTKLNDPPPTERDAFDAGARAMRDSIIEAIRRDQAWVDIGRINMVPSPKFGRVMHSKIKRSKGHEGSPMIETLDDIVGKIADWAGVYGGCELAAK